MSNCYMYRRSPCKSYMSNYMYRRSFPSVSRSPYRVFELLITSSSSASISSSSTSFYNSNINPSSFSSTSCSRVSLNKVNGLLWYRNHSSYAINEKRNGIIGIESEATMKNSTSSNRITFTRLKQGEGTGKSNFLFKLDLKGSPSTLITEESNNEMENNRRNIKGKKGFNTTSSSSSSKNNNMKVLRSKEMNNKKSSATSSKGRKKEMLKVVYRRGFNEAYSVFQNLTSDEKQNLQPMVYHALVYYAVLDIDNKSKFLRHKGVSEHWIGWESNDIKTLMFRLRDILQTMAQNEIFLPHNYILQIMKSLQNLGNHHYMEWMHDFFIDTHLHLYQGIYRIPPTPDGYKSELELKNHENATENDNLAYLSEIKEESSIRDGPLFDPEAINLMIVTFMNGRAYDKAYELFHELQSLQEEKKQTLYNHNIDHYNNDTSNHSADNESLNKYLNHNESETWVVLGTSAYSVIITDLIGGGKLNSALELIQEYTSIYGVNLFLYRYLLDHVIKHQAFDVLYDVLIETVKNNIPIDRGTCLTLLNLVSNHIARNDSVAEKKSFSRSHEESSIEEDDTMKDITEDTKIDANEQDYSLDSSSEFQNIDLISLLWEVAESSGYEIGAEHYHAALEAFAYQNKDKSILLALNEMCSRGISPSYASLCSIAKLMSQKGGIERVDMMYNDLLFMKEAADKELANLQELLEAQQQEEVKEESSVSKELDEQIGEEADKEVVDKKEDLLNAITIAGCQYQLHPEPVLLNLLAYAHTDLERTFSTFADFSKFFGHEQSVAAFNALLTATYVQQNTATRIIDNTSFGYASFQRLEAAFPMMNPETVRKTVFSILEDMKKNNVQPDTETYDLCVKITIQAQAIFPQYPSMNAKSYNNKYTSNQEFDFDDYTNNKSDAAQFEDQVEAYREECNNLLHNQNQDISQDLHMIMDHMTENNVTASPETYRSLSYWFADRSNNAENFNIVEECDAEMIRLNYYTPSNYKMRISKLRQPPRERIKNKKKSTHTSIPSDFHRSSITPLHTTGNSEGRSKPNSNNYDFLIPESYNSGDSNKPGN